MSVNEAVQLPFGQPAWADVTVGTTVSMVNVRLPFFMSAAGSAKIPEGVTGSAGFCPGTTLPLPGFVHWVVPVPFSVRETTTSKFPNPDMVAVHSSNKPLSEHDGLPRL